MVRRGEEKGPRRGNWVKDRGVEGGRGGKKAEHWRSSKLRLLNAAEKRLEEVKSAGSGRGGE